MLVLCSAHMHLPERLGSGDESSLIPVATCVMKSHYICIIEIKYMFMNEE